VSTNPVYQDEFVNFIETTYASSAATVFFDLDNEPNYWGFTHPEVWPFTGAVPCETPTVVTYDDILNRDMTYAAAIKTASPTAKLFGPVVAQDGIVYAHSYSADPHFPTEFVDYYLAQMAAATSPLLDVLDVHYYNEQNSSPSQCLQNPRMFWDPNYTELSPAGTDAIDFQYSGVNNYFDTNWYPRKVVPRLLGKIATAYASSTLAAPHLSFSEYNSGCETVIAGAIAEADDLGIFGREGVFAGALMPLDAPTSNYALAAIDLYRNYDGNGAVVGDTAVRATTSNVETTSVYAFAHSTNAAAVDVIAINKAASVVVATVSIANAPALTGATLYDIVDGSASVVAATGTAPTIACTGTTCTLTYKMPPMSATTLILR
jgi:mannan endo-1,4-beta-mannosidase